MPSRSKKIDKEPLLNQSLKESNKSVKSQSSTKETASAKATGASTRSQASTRSGTKTGKPSEQKNALASQGGYIDQENRGYRGPKREDPHMYDCSVKYVAGTICYLLTLYLFLFVVSFSILVVVYQRNKSIPFAYGKGSFIGGTPKIVIEPNPSSITPKANGKMEFDPTNPESFLKLLSRMKEIREEYTSDSTTDKCSKEKIEQMDGSYTLQSCSLPPLSDRNPYLGYGECDMENKTLDNSDIAFGFSRGEPCIMLRLSKILGVFPSADDVKLPNKTTIVQETLSGSNKSDTFTANDAMARIDSICGQNKNCCERKRISFQCSALTNIKVSSPISFDQYPLLGMSVCQFPYWNQDKYQQPFVMMKIRNLQKGNTKIECIPSVSSLQLLDDGLPNKVKLTIIMKEEPKERGITV